MATINYELPTVTVEWTSPDNTRRVVHHGNGKLYPQRYIVRSNGLDWQYEPEYRGYKTVIGARRAFR